MKSPLRAALFTVALALPSTAFAQSAPPPMRDSSLLGPVESTSIARRERDTYRLWATIGVDVGSSIVFSLAFSAPVIISPQSFSTTTQIGLVATGIGLSLIVPPLLVTLTGHAMGGRGTAHWAIIGKLLGLLVPVGGLASGALGYEYAHRNAILEGRF
jgi:hypothetical protein